MKKMNKEIFTLDLIICDDNWIEAIPETKSEMLDMYEAGKWTRDELLKVI